VEFSEILKKIIYRIQTNILHKVLLIAVNPESTFTGEEETEGIEGA